MKNKKTVLLIGAAILAVASIFYACTKDANKPGSSTVTPAAQQPQGASGNPLARGTGTQTYYSQDDSTGGFYQMVVTWSPSGVISVNRSSVTHGYPAGTATEHVIESGTGINIHKIDLDSDTTTYDTLKVTFNALRKYYVIGFHPSPTGNYLTIGNPCPSCSWVSWCSCLSTGGNCFLQVTRCQGCTQCLNSSRPNGPWDGNDGGTLRSVNHSGYLMVEASGINIIN